MTLDLYVDVKKLLVGGWMVVHLDYNVNSGPFLSFEIEIGDGPGPELDNKNEFSIIVSHTDVTTAKMMMMIELGPLLYNL